MNSFAGLKATLWMEMGQTTKVRYVWWRCPGLNGGPAAYEAE
jgi:hypothetical protein